MTRRILALVTATILGLGILTAAPASASFSDTPCTRVWLTAPSYFGHVDTGQRRCVWPKDQTNGWTRIYYRDDRGRHVIDYTHRFTKTQPNHGRVESTADAVRWVARKHNVHLQFANSDLVGRMGCAGGFINSVSGAYAPAAGEGLIRIGTGTTRRCMADRRTTLNVAKHEIAHAVIDRICGTTRPRMVYRPERGFNRIEEVTSAYAMKYLGATMNDGGMRPAAKDYWRADQLHAGRCA